MDGFPFKSSRFKSGWFLFIGIGLAGGLAACGMIPPSPSVSLASPTFSPPTVTSPSPLFAATSVPTLTPSSLPPSPTLLTVASITPTPSPTATPALFHLCSPLGGYTFDELPGIESQPFIPPRPGKDDGHHGVDFAHWQYKDRVSLEGAEVQSVLDGVVAASMAEKYPYGNMIIIETKFDQLSAGLISALSLQPDQSLYLLYAHLKEPALYTVGAPVRCGETLGLVGNTGASGNPHLHFETRTGPAGITFESMEYYKTTSTDEERTNYERWRFLGEFTLWDPWIVLKNGE